MKGRIFFSFLLHLKDLWIEASYITTSCPMSSKNHLWNSFWTLWQKVICETHLSFFFVFFMTFLSNCTDNSCVTNIIGSKGQKNFQGHECTHTHTHPFIQYHRVWKNGCLRLKLGQENKDMARPLRHCTEWQAIGGHCWKREGSLQLPQVQAKLCFCGGQARKL